MGPAPQKQDVGRKPLGETGETRSPDENQWHLAPQLSIGLKQDLTSLIEGHITDKKQEVTLWQLCQKGIRVIPCYVCMVWDEIGDDPIGCLVFGQLVSLRNGLAHGQKHIDPLSFSFCPEAMGQG